MIYVVAGIILGIVAGLNLNMVYSPDYVVYISVSILAIVNTIFALLNENLKGEMNALRSAVYMIRDLGFGLLMGYVGEQLGLPVYLAAVFAFGNSIYKNLSEMINFMLEKYNKNK